MKPHSTLFLAAVFTTAALSVQEISAQQNYKLRQSSSMMGMKSETTIYVKPMRKRTEAGGFMGQPNNQVTIEQCDKQRMITLNTKKKLYFIEPFQNDNDEVIDEDVKPAVKTKTAPVTTKDGGVIYNYYNIRDTGERKKMHGFTARHVWTTQKMKPSPEACSMKDSLIIKTDGWYIDLPEFNCPVRYKPSQTNFGGTQKPECKDRYVTRRSGKGKLGFPLIEKRTIIMGGQASTSEMVTDLETLELITGKQDSMLFEIPPDYTETKNYDELQDKFSAADMMNQYKNDDNKVNVNEMVDKMVTEGEKKPGTIRIGVYEPSGDGLTQPASVQQHLVGMLFATNIEAVSAASEEDAKSKKCDYSLSTDMVKMKQASKVGGLLKAIKNTDPNAATSFNIEANMVLTSLADGSVRSQQSISGKFDGKADDAAKKAVTEGATKILKDLK